MRAKYFILLALIISSCSVSEPGMQREELMITRKYVGNLIDHRRVEGEGLLDPDVVWLKTTLEPHYGKIGIYVTGELKLEKNERLYIRRYHADNPGIRHWRYFLESNDGELFYRLHGAVKGEEGILPADFF